MKCTGKGSASRCFQGIAGMIRLRRAMSLDTDDPENISNVDFDPISLKSLTHTGA